MDQTGYTVYLVRGGEPLDSDHDATRRDAMRAYARLVTVYHQSETIEVCVYRGTDLDMIASTHQPERASTTGG